MTFYLQAQLVDLRSEVTEAKAERAVVEREVHDQLLQLHALQLQLHAKQGQAEDSDSIKDRLVGRREEKLSTAFRLNEENVDNNVFLYLIQTIQKVQGERRGV